MQQTLQDLEDDLNAGEATYEQIAELKQRWNNVYNILKQLERKLKIQ